MCSYLFSLEKSPTFPSFSLVAMRPFQHSHWLLCVIILWLVYADGGIARQALWPLARRAVITALDIQNAYLKNCFFLWRRRGCRDIFQNLFACRGQLKPNWSGFDSLTLPFVYHDHYKVLIHLYGSDKKIKPLIGLNLI